LLRGNAGAVIVPDCDGAATTGFCSSGRRLFLPGKPAVHGYAFVDAASDPVQGSLKSDRGSPAPPVPGLERPVSQRR
jgi:hypothetical protein